MKNTQVHHLDAVGNAVGTRSRAMLCVLCGLVPREAERDCSNLTGDIVGTLFIVAGLFVRNRNKQHVDGSWWADRRFVL